MRACTTNGQTEHATGVITPTGVIKFMSGCLSVPAYYNLSNNQNASIKLYWMSNDDDDERPVDTTILFVASHFPGLTFFDALPATPTLNVAANARC